MMLRMRLLAAATLCFAALAACSSDGPSQGDGATPERLPAEAESSVFAFDDEGRLLRPEGYREWIFVGTPLTPNDMNNGMAPFPEFHNVYIDRASWAHYTQTGTFREGTTLVKELVSVGDKQATSGKGYFMGEFIGLEVTIKSEEHFPDEPGGWAYFSFGHEYPLAETATAFPAQSCNACHANTAADDFVFTQYYPHLRAAKGSKTPSVTWKGPQFDADGMLIRPEGYREWVYVGTPLTPNDMNDGNAPFPEFHAVYIDRASWAEYKKTGDFPEGTTLVKELLAVGSKQAVSGNGYFMGDFTGLEVTIKSKERFPDEPGGWAYFSFGHEYPLAGSSKAAQTLSCNACHNANAGQDWVFTQYYPVLSAAKPGAKTTRGASAHDGANCADCKTALKAADATTASAKTPAAPASGQVLGSIPTEKEALFKFLTEGKYKEFAASESGAHPSAGPHSIKGTFGQPVRSFFNEAMNTSLQAGNTVHPRGAGIVKEMFSKDGKTVQGYAVALKTEEESAGGNGWFWYEVTSVTDSSAIVANGTGVPLCYGCHSGGTDFVLTRFPQK